jgi:hypothetical protein
MLTLKRSHTELSKSVCPASTFVQQGTRYLSETCRRVNRPRKNLLRETGQGQTGPSQPAKCGLVPTNPAKKHPGGLDRRGLNRLIPRPVTDFAAPPPSPSSDNEELDRVRHFVPVNGICGDPHRTKIR